VIQITPTLALDESEITEQFIRASGPGGQNVNKVASAVQIRFDAARSSSLPDDVRIRLLEIAGKRASNEGIIVIDARRFRTQARNREDAIQRLIALIRKALEKPKPRRPTRPTAAAHRRRIETKRQRGEVKKARVKKFLVDSGG
jgi:ribosome-associated protein